MTFSSALFLSSLALAGTDATHPVPEIERDIAKLVAAASQLHTAWPWQAPIPEVQAVARHGMQAAPRLVRLLKFESFTQQEPWDLHVEQQAELALCAIYNLQPEAGKTVYSVRSTDKENRAVRQFWQRKVRAN